MKLNAKLRRSLKDNRNAWIDMFYILRKELYGIFTDKGTLIIFFLATLVYPLVCGYVYNREMMYDAPIAVVDNSHSSLSRQLVRMLDATPEVHVAYNCMNMKEAEQLQRTAKVHGIVHIPEDFSSDINKGKQATVGVYGDVTSFFWYRNLVMAATYTTRTMGYGIEVKNLVARGMGYDDAMRAVRPFVPQQQVLYQPGGYPSFMLPIIVIILLQQTILMGIGILAGKTTERSANGSIVPKNIHYNGLFRIIFGRVLAVFLTYIPITVYVLIIVPHYFNVPQLYSSPLEVLLFIIPFLLASILLGMTCSVFFHHRENAIPFFAFMSIPILFLSGLPWPREAMPDFWRYFSYILPTTFASNGFVRMGSFGATLAQISKEHFALWILVAVYLTTTFFAYRYRLIKGLKGQEGKASLFKRISARKKRMQKSNNANTETNSVAN